MLKRLSREPLLHFVLAALLIFVGYDMVAPKAPKTDRTVIVVDRTAILKYLQSRRRAFEPKAAAARFAALTPQKRQRLIDDFVRDEVLHREALSLGLDRGDDIIRRRLIQKVKYLNQGLTDDEIGIDNAALAAFFEENRAAYGSPPQIVFTHIFFSAKKRGARGARAAAEAKLAELNRTAASFNYAMRHGDYFPYHRNYVERTQKFVASNFGRSAAQAIFEMPPDPARWRGPVASPFGQHLVLVAKQRPAAIPSLKEIRARVERDALRQVRLKRGKAAIDALVARYEVRIELSSGKDSP